jgi:Holliday junction resolvasome RuvABC ATP-dependent DNA helicase subunit
MTVDAQNPFPVIINNPIFQYASSSPSALSWKDIGGLYTQLLNKDMFAKRVATAVYNKTDELIVNTLLKVISTTGWVSVMLAYNYVYNRYVKELRVLYQDPTIDMKQHWKDPTTSKLGVISRIFSKAMNAGAPVDPPKIEALSPPATECIFNEEIQSTVDQLTLGVNESIKHGRSLPNAIFYGAPGVGKSMLLEKIALNFPGNYMYFTASALRAAMSSGQHLWELKSIFAKIEKSKFPTVLVIDESELLFMDRRFLIERGMTNAYDLLESFLKYTGTPSKKFMVVLATNHISKVDEALLDRMALKKVVKLPAVKERLAILKINIALKFKGMDFKVLTEEITKELAVKTEGFSGRGLVQLLDRIATLRDISSAKKLTMAIVGKALEECSNEIQEAAQALELPKTNK